MGMAIFHVGQFSLFVSRGNGVIGGRVAFNSRKCPIKMNHDMLPHFKSCFHKKNAAFYSPGHKLSGENQANLEVG